MKVIFYEEKFLNVINTISIYLTIIDYENLNRNNIISFRKVFSLFLFIKIYMKKNKLNDYEKHFTYQSPFNIEDIQNKFVIRINFSIESFYESKDNTINIIINIIGDKTNLKFPI